MGSWPSTLPVPQAGSYQIEPADQTLRSDMEIGYPRVRRITYARNDVIPCTWKMSNEQFVEFRAWFLDDVDGAAGGAAWCTIPLVSGVDTADVADHTARFSGPWTASSASGGLYWLVSAKLEVR